MQPAARLARDGVDVIAEHASLHTLLDGVMSHQPACAAVFQPDGRPLREGERQYNPQLADTIERLAENGAAEFATGETARAIVEEMRSTGGSITAEDLARYAAIERTPLEVAFRGRQLYLNPPPASGGSLVAHTLAVLDRFAAVEDVWDVDALYRLIGSLRAAQVARTPAFERGLYDGSAGRLLLDEHAVEAGVALAERGGGQPLEPAGAPNTTHISVLDAAGNGAAMTCTTGCGAGVFAGDTGVHLNNMLGETDLAVKAVRLEPGDRLTSMMSPVLAFRGGERRPCLSIGSSGSARLRSSIVQVLVHVFDHGLAPDAATEHPRVHPQGAEIECEGGVPERVMAGLETRGERVVRWPDRNGYFGAAQVVVEQDGRLLSAGDPRRGGSGLVVETD
jgi:gamma-glutamyltranspeptidase/glutathione hydrolase